MHPFKIYITDKNIHICAKIPVFSHPIGQVKGSTSEAISVSNHDDHQGTFQGLANNHQMPYVYPYIFHILQFLITDL